MPVTGATASSICGRAHVPRVAERAPVGRPQPNPRPEVAGVDDLTDVDGNAVARRGREGPRRQGHP